MHRAIGIVALAACGGARPAKPIVANATSPAPSAIDAGVESAAPDAELDAGEECSDRESIAIHVDGKSATAKMVVCTTPVVRPHGDERDFGIEQPYRADLVVDDGSGAPTSTRFATWSEGGEMMSHRSIIGALVAGRD